MDAIAREVEYIVRTRLEEFAKSKQTGMVTIDVQISQGKPTAINTSTKENRKLE